MFLKDANNFTVNKASTLTTARTINGTSFSGSADITTANWGTARNITIGNTSKSVNGSGNVSWTLSEIGAAASGHTHNYAGSSSAGGAANSATVLATTRKINGTSFNGSADITTANWGATRTIAIGATVKSVNGSGNYSWSASEILGGQTIGYGNFGGLIIERTGSTNGASIGFKNSNGTLGYIGMNAVNGGLLRWSVDTNSQYTVLDTGNYKTHITPANIGAAISSHTHSYLPLSGGTVSGSINPPSDVYGSLGNSSLRWAEIHALTITATTLKGNATSAAKLSSARTINGTNFDGTGNITTANWGTARTLTVGNASKSVNGNGNVSWTLDEMGAASRSPFSNTYKQITVGGDANTYYPVLITMNRPGIGYPWYNISISRAYNATAPDTWNTATHKGGLTFQFRWSGDTGWGGNDHNLQVVEFSERYTTMVAGFTLSVSGIVVWLRGGGAVYQLNCEQGIGINATVTLGTYTSEDKTTYPVRTNTNSVANEIHKLWVQRGGSVYDNNSRVYSPNNKPTPSEIGAAPALALANSYYGMVTNDGNSSNWIRTTKNGILPYASGGSSHLGASGWPFTAVYATNFYGTLNGNATHWGGRQVWWGAAGSRPGNGYIQFVW